MANTFSQIYIQAVFAVSGRQSLTKPTFKEELYKYITGIVRNQGQKLIAINGVEDHLHIDGDHSEMNTWRSFENLISHLRTNTFLSSSSKFRLTPNILAPSERRMTRFSAPSLMSERRELVPYELRTNENATKKRPGHHRH